MAKIPLRKEGIVYIIVLELITLIIFHFIPIIAIIPLILLFFIIYFFSDPNKIIDIDDKVLLSPADGTVMDIKDVTDGNFQDGKVQKVTTFLSIFNVHVNRSPISGKVIAKGYRPGKYLPAFKSHASELDVKVKNGDTVRGGRTVIGVVK